LKPWKKKQLKLLKIWLALEKAALRQIYPKPLAVASMNCLDLAQSHHPDQFIRPKTYLAALIPHTLETLSSKSTNKKNHQPGSMTSLVKYLPQNNKLSHKQLQPTA